LTLTRAGRNVSLDATGRDNEERGHGGSMLQRYRLRRGDGTVLTVDLDGLRTWLADGRATVQVGATQEWRPLREVLAEEESAARLARALVPPEPRRAPATSPPEVPPPSPPAEPSIGKPPLVQALAEEPAASRTPAPPWADPREAADEARPIRLKPLDDEPPAPYPVPQVRMYDDDGEEPDPDGRHDRLEGPLLHMISAFGTLLSRCLAPLTPLVSDWPSTEAPDPPSEPAPERPRAPVPRAPLAAPVPVSELPVLRFADAQEAREKEDIYEGEEAHGPFPTLWLWTKRIVLVGGLATGGVLAVLHRETWFPRAAEVGQTVFTEIDRQARSGQRAREQEQALREATERLPQLAPETIRLVLSTSASGVLAAPEVFRIASEAADRGQGALTPAEATELRALQRELLGHLRPAERAQVAEYDRARARRVVFPFENPHPLELVARGARAMPPQIRERLQVLLGRAVAAGLGAPAASPEVSPADAGVKP